MQNDERKVSYQNRITAGEKNSYGAAAFAGCFLITMITLGLYNYYPFKFDLEESALRAILTIGWLLHATAVLVMGGLMDAGGHAFSNQKKWLRWSAIPLVIFAILMSFLPAVGASLQIIYLLAVGSIFAVLCAAYYVPYAAMQSTLTQDQEERESFNVFRMGYTAGAVYVATRILNTLDYRLSRSDLGWFIAFLIFAVFVLFLYGRTYRNTTERNPVTKHSTLSLEKVIRAFFTNKQAVFAVMIIFISVLQVAIQLHSSIFYGDIFMDNQRAGQATFGIVSMVMLIGSLLFTAPLIRKYGKRNSIIIGTVISLLGTVVLMVGSEYPAIFIVGFVLKALGWLPLGASIFAMLADTVEYGELISGLRIPGMIFGVGSFAVSMAIGLGTMGVSWLYYMIGYQPGGLQTGIIRNTTMFFFLYFPAILAVIQIVLLAFYKLDHKYTEVLEELRQKKTVQTSEDQVLS
ncbi:Na+/melibiose symporter [Terribacillus halophilus]|uniref:Na+/melibiose symporter n=1 Tax=Terribacillus halophilus TaxID=361279 RepID=A0A1G6S9V3_9BACI|nr:MFS transporter [Terribacillus halophilus]SDD12887.1 Na+/melibiose symporter [Terribacillus halophilus]